MNNNNLLGKTIKSTALLNHTYFENTEIIIVEENSNGHLGFVINNPFGRTLNELIEFKHSKPFSIYEGGPMEQEKLFFIHQRNDLIKEGVAINNHWFYSGNFKQAIEAINHNLITEKDIQLFVGYCGWNNNELFVEIEEGSWEIVISC